MALIAGVQYGTPITSTTYTGIPPGTILPCGHGVAINSISATSPAVVSTGTIPHGLVTGDSVSILGTSTTPSTNATYTVTVISTTTFSIPVVVTIAGGAVGVVSKIPTRTLLCDGTSYTTTAYPALFSAIGYSFGGSAGNFNVPDFRGQFLRGVDGTASRDPDKASRTAMKPGGNTGNNVGSIQGHQYASHSHSLTVTAPASNPARWTNGGGGAVGGTDSTSGSGGNETRPVNAYVNYCIAY